MNFSLVAFTGSILTAVVSFCIAIITVIFNRITAKEMQLRNEILAKELRHLNENTSKELEELKFQLSDLNNRAFLKFSKHHEIQVEILKKLNTDVSRVREEFYKTSSENDCKDLSEALEGLRIELNTHSIFLDERFRITIQSIIFELSNYEREFDAIFDRRKTGLIEDLRFIEKKKNLYYEYNERYIEFERNLFNDVKAFLINGD